jgi:hypothetical protein
MSTHRENLLSVDTLTPSALLASAGWLPVPRPSGARTKRRAGNVSVPAEPSPPTREHERKKVSRGTRIRTAHPRIGGLVLAPSDDPQSTTEWAVAARGEELLAELLVGLATGGSHIARSTDSGTRATSITSPSHL